MIQDERLIRVIKQGAITSEKLKQVGYAAALGFEDNQFKKQRVDKHDQVISMLHATKEALINPFTEDEVAENTDK